MGKELSVLPQTNKSTISSLLIELNNDKEELGLALIEQGAELTLPCPLKAYTESVKNLVSNKKLDELRANTVPRDLSVFPTLGTTDRSATYVYVDGEKKVSIRNLNSYLLRTVDKVPEDIQPGEYIFLEKGE